MSAALDLHALTLLVEILDAGNLSEAARRLKMSRANVSYHLNALEKTVGQQLVRRTTRRIAPTEIGLRLYDHGRQIRNELQSAQDTLANLGQGLQGRVRLSVPDGRARPAWVACGLYDAAQNPVWRGNVAPEPAPLAVLLSAEAEIGRAHV